MRIVLRILFLFAFPACALAFPGSGGADRFSQADRGHDGRLDRDEFIATFSSIRAEAFDALDTDGDGVVSRAEWDVFSSAHSGSRQEAVPPQHEGDALPLLPLPNARPAAPVPEAQPREGPPLLLPPETIPPARPAAPSGQSADLPLLEPPEP